MIRDDTEADTETPVVRQLDFSCGEPVEIVVELGAGLLDIRLDTPADADDAGVSVRIRPDTGGMPWQSPFAGLLSWLGGQTGVAPTGELAEEAAQRTDIAFADRRLTVRTPQDVLLQAVPLIVRITAPAGSSVTARSSSADISVDGVAARFEASTGSGRVRAQRCTGAAEIRTGSGDVRLGTMLGPVQLRTGSGAIDVVALTGEDRTDGTGTSDNTASDSTASDNTVAESTVRTGSGDVRFGVVGRDLTARTGSGDLVVVDASAGKLELSTGSGRLRVGIHSGVLAELDVSSGSGKARSELPVGTTPPPGEAALRVRARTGSGDALVTSAPPGSAR